MSQTYEFFELPETHTLSIRTTTTVENLSDLIGSSYGAIMQYMAELKEPVVCEPFVIYYNLDMQNLDVEMGFPVSRKLPACGEIKSSSLPIGPVVQTTFTGTYEEMAPVYEEMGQFVKDNGHETSGISIEYYLTGPDIPAEEQVTRIVFPIKKSM
ncbi:MAG: GyrI-like domain-containing protein [Chloroflexi bacterium]|nr:GyrI-like domain-containing protein [Chloroflexota bacterium]